MQRGKLPADQIRVAPVEAFAPGSLVFGPYMEHAAERLQIGIKIGVDREVLALTPWFGGHRHAGSLVIPRPDRPIFGIQAATQGVAQVEFDPTAVTDAAPDFYRGAAGLLGFGTAGLTLAVREDDGFGFAQGAFVNPLTWSRMDIAHGHFPLTWTSSWAIRFPLTPEDWFAITPDRLATSA